MTSNKFNFLEWTVWYEKFGSGPTPLLLIPGSIGTGLSDFRQQLIGENAIDQTAYTLIAVEVPGWGRSRPPARPYNGKNVYHNDADCCAQLMKSLGYDRFAIVGWSDGGIVGLLMAVEYPECVRALVSLSAPAVVSTNTRDGLRLAGDIKTWDARLLDNYYQVYGDYSVVQHLWTNHVKFVEGVVDSVPSGPFDERLAAIRCPVLLLHGDKDVIVEVEQPLRLQKIIKGAKLFRFRNGAHNSHQTNAKQFKSLVENFINIAIQKGS